MKGKRLRVHATVGDVAADEKLAAVADFEDPGSGGTSQSSEKVGFPRHLDTLLRKYAPDHPPVDHDDDYGTQDRAKAALQNPQGDQQAKPSEHEATCTHHNPAAGKDPDGQSRDQDDHEGCSNKSARCNHQSDRAQYRQREGIRDDMTQTAMQERHCRNADQTCYAARSQSERAVQPMTKQLVHKFDCPNERQKNDQWPDALED